MDEVKVSVIIPVYNTSLYLEKCLRTVMNQSLKEIEIICVNDGSTDNSLEILERLQKEDNRIIVIDKKNEGASKARNTALKIAKGKYCLNIDSDDWIEQEYFKALYERAEKDDLDVTLSNIIIDFKEKNKKNYILNDLKISDEKIVSGKEYINIFLRDNFYGYTCNKLIKTKLYKKNKIIYKKDIFMMEDVEVILRLAYFAKRIGKINKAYYHYVKHSSNGSNNKKNLKNIYDIEKCFDSLLEFFILDEIIKNKILEKKYLILFNCLKGYFFERKENEFIRFQEKFLSEIQQIKFYKIQGELRLNRVSINILKIFSNKKILNFIIKVNKILMYLRNIL